MNTSAIKSQLRQLSQSFVRLRIVLFLIMLIVVYGFVAWRANTLATAEPDAAAVASQAKASNKPQIDQATIEKIEQLEDNSVTVKALFDQARQNPFRE